MILDLGRESGWTFNTCNGLSIGAGLVAGEAGTVTLNEPHLGNAVKFYLGGLGVGFTWGFKLPKLKIPKINAPKLSGGTGSLEAMPSHGLVYMASTFRGQELTRRDIRGGCCFVEGGGGFAWGMTADAMIFGMNPMLLAASLAASSMGNPGPMQHAMLTATGYLLWRGVNFGVQASVGAAVYIGALYA